MGVQSADEGFVIDNLPNSRRFISPVPAGMPKDAPGEVLVKLAPGADAQAIAAHYGINIKERLRFAPDHYVFSGITTNLEQAAQTLRQTPGVVQATTNRYYRPAALPRVTPNDPLVDDQWALDVLGADQVWGITVGERLVNGPRRTATVGLLDFGPQTSHPDLQDVIRTDGFDFILDAPYDETQAVITEAHGTNMASAIAGVTNNQEGLSSIPWEAVEILPCQIGEFVTVGNTVVPTFSVASAIDAIYFCIEKEVDVINMSFADFPFATSGFANPLFGEAVTDAYEQGIVLVGAAGDNRSFFAGSNVSYPARYPEVIAVGAVGPTSERAFYSQGGPDLDLVAPGGNDNTFTFDATRQVIVADSSGFNFLGLPEGYTYTQGTSVAAAYVSGIIATLITQGAYDQVDATLPASERVDYMRELLQQTARSPNGGRTDDFGYGVVNPEAALRRITQVIDIDSPAPNEITESFGEPFRFRISQPVPDPLTTDDFRVEQNGTDITDRVNIVDPASGTVEYIPTPESQYLTGLNSLNVVAENALNPDAERSLSGINDGLIPARSFRFRVQPRRLLPGRRMVSFPYDLQPTTDNLEFLFGGNLVRLARWLPDENRYAIFDIIGSPQDPEAALKTADAGVARPPVGVGFWARINSITQVQLFGESARVTSYDVPLKTGFNLIGNPYPFRVPTFVINVRYGNETMSIEEAVRRRLIANSIWRLTDRGYTFETLRNGELVDWEGHWIRAFAPVTLQIPRVASGSLGNTQFSAARSGMKAATSGPRRGVKPSTTAPARGYRVAVPSPPGPSGKHQAAVATSGA